MHSAYQVQAERCSMPDGVYLAVAIDADNIGVVVFSLILT